MEGERPRASSVPPGKRPTLVVNRADPGQGASCIPEPPREARRRDPYLEPEVVTARARVETVKNLGRRFQTTSRLIDHFLVAARAELGREGGSPEEVGRILEWLEAVNEEALFLSAKAEVGMAEFHLPQLVRDAAKRVYQRCSNVRLKLPELTESFPVILHPHHLLDALTMAMDMVLDRAGEESEICATLARDRYFAHIRISGRARPGKGGTMPTRENIARLKHLVVGLHQGTIASDRGSGGEVVITIGLPLECLR